MGVTWWVVSANWVWIEPPIAALHHWPFVFLWVSFVFLMLLLLRSSWKPSSCCASPARGVARRKMATGGDDPWPMTGSHGHYFLKKNFHKPSYCHHCSDLVWGLLGQGYVCEGKHNCSSSNGSKMQPSTIPTPKPEQHDQLVSFSLSLSLSLPLSLPPPFLNIDLI